MTGCQRTLGGRAMPQCDGRPYVDHKAVQAILDETLANAGASGAQLSLQLGEERADFVAGTASSERAQAMTVDTLVQIGSTTKLFNAMLIMTLVDEGKLDLDMPVKYYAPFTLNHTVAETTLSLKHLLSMSSGLDNGPYTEQGRGDDALARYVSSLREIPQIFLPGQGYGYSNAGTAIAGYIAECVTGQRWDDLLKDRILGPAGLNNAGTLDDLFFQCIAVGHRLNEDGSGFTVIRSPWRAPRGLEPAGSTLMISARDLVSFGQIFLNGGVADNGTRILSAQAVRTMMTAITPIPSIKSLFRHYGVGPTCSRWNGGEYWAHEGLNLSGGSVFKWIPKIRGIFACTTNTPWIAHKSFFPALIGRILPEVFGMSEPKVIPANLPIRNLNANRFEGDYASLYFKYEVRMRRHELWIKEYLTVPAEGGGIETVSLGQLKPLGGDCFLYIRPGSLDADDPRCVAFFGDDSEGRAVNFVDTFPARRVTAQLNGAHL